MFDFAFVILPFSDVDPGEAVRASLARYQRGLEGEVPDEWLVFDDETLAIREAHESEFTFSRPTTGGLSIQGATHLAWFIDGAKVTAEMDRRGLSSWTIRFGDVIDVEAFHDQFSRRSRRDPKTGRYGRWLNGLGRWDWWDLGGRFDGQLTGDRPVETGRPASHISSGENQGRRVLANIEDSVGNALGQGPPAIVGVRVDRNIELASTVLETLLEGDRRKSAGTVVLPPGSMEDRLRWMDAWPVGGPTETFVWLGLAPDAPWVDVVEASLKRFSDHWVAGVAYHL